MQILIILLVSLSFLTNCTSGHKQGDRNISSLVNDNGFSDLYLALGAPEKVLPAQRSILRYEKVIGTLTCSRTSYQHLSDQYKCVIKDKAISHRDIYNSLEIEEIALPSDRMALK